ncbi:MAG: thioesterase family protein [Deltaproteobacteria bacterium]|nr:thioesterase family protein [Deltaproteobacteria bacterium]MBW2448652.1 thioesterase family protein [Deltaproteobacteria bacterium]
MTGFDRDIAVEQMAPGRYRARLGPAWWIVAGPNGGYMAAVILRAIEATVGDPRRLPRSLTVHYTRRPEGEDVEIETTVERSGRSLSTVTARMLQGDRLIAHAVAALSLPRPGFELHHAELPKVASLADSKPRDPTPGAMKIAFHDQFDMRWAIPEAPWSGAETARAAAWMRLAEPRVADAALIATLADALPPAVFAVASEPSEIGHIPTIDLTVHFRAPLPPAGLGPEDHLLLNFTTRVVSDGFLEEDGEIWSPDGTLLAQSRQLAILA